MVKRYPVNKVDIETDCSGCARCIRLSPFFFDLIYAVSLKGFESFNKLFVANAKGTEAAGTRVPK